MGVESHAPDWHMLPSMDEIPNTAREGSTLTLSELNSLEPLIYSTKIYSTATTLHCVACQE